MQSRILWKSAACAVSVAVAALGMVSPATAGTPATGTPAAAPAAPAAAGVPDGREAARKAGLELVPIDPQHIEGPYVIKHRASGRCVESNYSGHTFTRVCNGTRWQGWVWETYQEWQGWWRVKNYETGMCLDGANGRVYTHQCNGGGNQYWVKMPSGHIPHRASQNGYLDANLTGSVYLSPRNNSDYQKWDLFRL